MFSYRQWLVVQWGFCKGVCSTLAGFGPPQSACGVWGGHPCLTCFTHCAWGYILVDVQVSTAASQAQDHSLQFSLAEYAADLPNERAPTREYRAREESSHKNWAAARARLVPISVENGMVPNPAPICSTCGLRPSVLRCFDCPAQHSGVRNARYLCGSCDSQQHPHVHLHRREHWSNGFPQRLPMHQCFEDSPLGCQPSKPTGMSPSSSFQHVTVPLACKPVGLTGGWILFARWCSQAFSLGREGVVRGVWNVDGHEPPRRASIDHEEGRDAANARRAPLCPPLSFIRAFRCYYFNDADLL
jgi:hypothetical protein